MKSIKLEGAVRSDLGKTATRRIRSEGKVPGVIYGGDGSVHFTATQKDLKPLIYTSEFMAAEISVDGKTYRTILKDLQFDVVTDDLNHVDFLELVENKKVTANLPLKYVGQSKGVKEGGRLVVKLKTLKVRCLPKDLVEAIEVDLTNLEINGNIRVEDVKTNGMEIMNSPRIPIASVVMTRALKQAESEEAKKK